METRTCNKCEQEKPLDTDNFYFRANRGNYETTCKKCRNQRKAGTRDLERERQLSRDWYSRNSYRELKRRKRNREKMTEEERVKARDVARAKHVEYRKRKIQEYLDEHGTTPLCACGCGEHVKFNNQGKPRKFAGQNHHMDTAAMSQKMSEIHAERAAKEDRIPIDVFRDAVRQVKEQKGWSWVQMAEAGGWSVNHLKSTVFDQRAKNVGRQLGEDFFNRIAGRPAPPSNHMLKQAADEMWRLNYKENLLDRTFMQRQVQRPKPPRDERGHFIKTESTS